MKKRILSLLLAVVLCLSLLPTAALAEEGTGAVAEVTKNNAVSSYATLQEAFNAVENCTESSIASVKLLADITLESGLTISGGVFTLDLNGKTVNYSDVDANAVSMTGGTVTLTDHGTGNGTIGQKFVVNGGTLNMSGGKIAGSLVLGNPAGKISLSGGSFDSIRIDTPTEGSRGLADLLAEGYAFQQDDELQSLQSLTGESTIKNVIVVKCTHPYISIGECHYCGSIKEIEEISSITVVGNGNSNWLNGASWEPDNASNHMKETPTGSGVYEITYTGVAAGEYTVKFVANDEWTHYWGAAYDDKYNLLPNVAAYNGDNISFSVAEDNSTVELVLDLSKLDRTTGAGVRYTIHDGPDLTPCTQDGLLTIDEISGYDTQWGYNYLYFGKVDTAPILWRVLSTSGNATGDTDSLREDDTTVSNDDAMFLLSEYLLGQDDSKYNGIVFNANGTAYKDSNAQKWCGELLTGFTENEQNAVLATVKSDAASTNDRNLPFPAVENILNGDKVFLPSVEEMKNAKYGFSSENDLIAYSRGNTAGDWWMRSAGTGKSVADAEYNTARTEYKIYTKLANEHSYARPAFNLSKNDVLFVCTADGVKTGTVGSTLTAIKSNLSSEWKLTLLDKSRNFSVSETEAEKFADGTLTLHYTGAKTGENEYISAIFYDADGKPTYYGMLKNLTGEADAEGSVELTVPKGLAEGQYQIVLFNEQYNGECMTDYASSFCTVTLTVDNTDPELSGFAVSRTSDSTATVDFIASESGAYYYVVDENETISSIDTTSNRIAMITGKQTLELDKISAGKSYLHILAKDEAGNVSEVYTITILGFLPAPTNADWDDATLGKVSWSAVTNASGYSVQLYKDGAALGSAVTVRETNYTFIIPEPPAEDGDDSTTTTPTLPDNAITEAGTYSFQVTALGDGTDYSNSVAAESARHLSSITVEENENGTVTASARYAVAGTEITLTGDPNSGYRFHEWNITPEVTVTDNKFVMPEEAVTVSAVFTQRTYPITVKDSTNGNAFSSHKSAFSGTTVTITVMPDKGYILETLIVTDKNGNELTLTDKGGGKYTFTMPTSNVTVTAIFMEDNTMLNFFVDVKASDYYYDAVLWAAQNGITAGTDAVHFTPDGVCSRAQAVTFLWRAAGSPVPKSASMPFTDVLKGSYYETAVLWAVENGITKGTSNTTFSPNATCSRAQIVSFLWRSQKSPAVGSVNPFTDVSANAYYTDAVLWAVEENITKGTTATTFSPDADCTRAQSVTLLYRAYVK